jgi:hypothetical protein
MDPADRPLVAIAASVAMLVVSASVASAQGGGGASQTGTGGPGVIQVSGAPMLPSMLPEGSGAISGTVLDASTGTPLVGAIVTISVANRAQVSRAPREMTDGRGRFLFTKLPARDDYHLTAAMPGYFDGYYGQDSPRPANNPIALTDGQWFSSASIQLWKGGSISGTVLDDHGDPMVGILVHVLVQTLVGGTRQLASGPVGTTDDRGLYRIAGLGPGDYFVSVPSVAATVPASTRSVSGSASLFAFFDADSLSRLAVGKAPLPPAPVDGRRLGYPVTYGPDATSLARATPITLTNGESRSGVDVRLEPTPTFTITGRVDGPPEMNSGLILRLLPTGLESLGTGSETATTLVAPNGTFVFLNVPSGAYSIDIRHSSMEFAYNLGGPASRLPMAPGVNGYSVNSDSVDSAPPGVQYTSTTVGSGSDAWGHTSVTVAAADVGDVVMTLRHGVRISGHWTREEKDQSTGVKPAAFFAFARAEPSNGSPSTGLATQNPRGDNPQDFELAGLTPGQYVLRFGGSGQESVVKSITLDGVDYTNRLIDVSDGHDVSNVQVTFTDDVPTLNGTIRNVDNTIKDVSIVVFPVEPDQWANYGLTPVRIKTASASAQGAFHVATLPQGEYFVIAVPKADADAWQDPAFLKLAARTAARVSLRWGQTTTVDVTPARIR